MNISGVPTDLQPRCLQSFKPSVVIVGGITGISQDFNFIGRVRIVQKSDATAGRPHLHMCVRTHLGSAITVVQR